VRTLLPFLLLLGGCPAPDGAALYGSTCAGCHGADGGQGTQIDGVVSPDLGETVPALDDAALATIIRDGVGVMPPQLVDEADIDAVVAYCRERFGGPD
jgi:mono/diheme cytochrome c family protein